MRLNKIEYLPILLVIIAFGLGSCPFSVWIGQWLLKKDVRRYGDANPGAANVFRAGGRKAGCLALALDAGKGIPIVILASKFFDLSLSALYLICLSSILGHAFSPFLRFRGGKAVAVTYGALVALPQREIFLLFAIFMFLGFLLIETHSWVIMLGPIGSLAFLILTGIDSADFMFLLAILIIFTIKNFPDLKKSPGYQGVLFQWLQIIRR
jgi:acyl phosphate:glycerol-3-phosphate acyltransferase